MFRAPELTARALLIGAAIGAVMAAANVYIGLKIAFIDGGAMTAAVLGWAALRYMGPRIVNSRETNVIQATASSAAVMVGVIGLAGPWPALLMRGHVVPAWALAGWGVTLGTLGVGVGVLLGPALVTRERLPFPSGRATAEVIRAISARGGDGMRHAAVLVAASVGAGLVVWLQQGLGIVPEAVSIPIAWLGVAVAETGIAVSLSPLVVGTGLLVGLRTGTAMAVAGVVGWLVLVPWLARLGAITGSDYAAGVAWLIWPALGLFISETLVVLANGSSAARRMIGDLRAAARRSTRQHLGLALALALIAMAVVGIGRFVVGVDAFVLAVSLALAVVLATICGRAAGETDVAPVGSAGALGQIVVGSSGVVPSFVGGSIPAGVAAQTAQTLWSLAATRELGGRRGAIAAAQVCGVFAGTAVSVPVYLVVVAAYGLGSEQLPAWGAVAWGATADAVQGAVGTPPGALLGSAFGLATGLVLAWARTRSPKRVPFSATALGVGLLVPLAFSFAVLAGGLAGALWSSRRPGSASRWLPGVAAGAIAGEAIVAIGLAALAAATLGL